MNDEQYMKKIIRLCQEINEELELIKRKNKPHLRLDPQVAERLK